MDDDDDLNHERKNTSNVHEPLLLYPYMYLNKQSFAAAELVDSIVAVNITLRVSVGVRYSTSPSIYWTLVTIYDHFGQSGVLDNMF